MDERLCDPVSTTSLERRWAEARSYMHASILPRDGLMTLVQQGDRGGEKTLDGTVPEFRGVGRRLSTPSFPAVEYCSGYDAEIIAADIRKSGYRSGGRG